MPNPARRTIALAALTVAIIAAAVALDLASAAAQSEDEQAGRIVARRLDDGRTEFGWQPAGGARVLPRARYFPADAPVERWLNSSPVEVGGAEIGRINARLRDDGRIEFAFTPTDGERIAPRARYFPVDARVGRWLRSTTITIDSTPPPPVISNGFSAVSAGLNHSCAIRAESGAIECWGINDSGQTDAPTGRFTAIADGMAHSCGLHESGAIECWGWNSDGQTDAPAGAFRAVSAGAWHTCAIRTSGAIQCWGGNAGGQADAPAGSDFSAVSAGELNSCGLRESGAIECWGINADGEADAPTGRFSAVAVGRWHTCGLRESGAIECWGSDEEGQADYPTTGTFIAVSASANHSCAIRTRQESGQIECWGGDGRALI